MGHKTFIITIAVFFSLINMLQFWQPNANQRTFWTWRKNRKIEKIWKKPFSNVWFYFSIWMNEMHRAAVHTEYIQNSVIKMYQHNASCNWLWEKKNLLYRKRRCSILFGGHLCKPGDDILKHDKTREYWSPIMQNQRWIDKDRLSFWMDLSNIWFMHTNKSLVIL